MDEVVTAVAAVMAGMEVVGRRVTPCRAGWSTTLEDLNCCWSCAASRSCCCRSSRIPPNCAKRSWELLLAVVVVSLSVVCVPLPDRTWIWTPPRFPPEVCCPALIICCCCCWGVKGGEVERCEVMVVPLPLFVVWTLLLIMVTGPKFLYHQAVQGCCWSKLCLVAHTLNSLGERERERERESVCERACVYSRYFQNVVPFSSHNA